MVRHACNIMTHSNYSSQYNNKLFWSFECLKQFCHLKAFLSSALSFAFTCEYHTSRSHETLPSCILSRLCVSPGDVRLLNSVEPASLNEKLPELEIFNCDWYIAETFPLINFIQSEFIQLQQYWVASNLNSWQLLECYSESRQESNRRGQYKEQNGIT